MSSDAPGRGAHRWRRWFRRPTRAGPPEPPERAAGTHQNPHQPTRTHSPITEAETTAVAPPVPQPPPDAFPGYRIERVVGRGGQGVVYEALQQGTGRRVAIKVLLHAAHASPTARQRFAREIRLAASLRHPNIVTVFHADTTSDGLPYFVMDYVRGQPLSHYVRDRRLGQRARLRLFAHACRAVAAAHAARIVHCDLKPENILVTPDDQPHVLDFGLARPSHVALTDPATTASLAGTLPYLAPEQLAGQSCVDARSDVYSLGVVLYCVLFGRFPYPVRGSLGEVIEHIRHTPPRLSRRRWALARLRRPDVPQADGDLEAILRAALEKDPDRRYADAGELADDLDRYLAGLPVRSRQRSGLARALVRMRHAGSRRPVLSASLITLVWVFVAQQLVAPAVFSWSPANRAFEASLAGLTPVTLPRRLDHVRVVRLDRQTDIAALARELGRPDIDPAQGRSLRALHGALMEHIADSGLRVMAFNITFIAPSPWDEAFLRGVRALRDRGVKVLVAAPYWRHELGGGPALSPALRPWVEALPTSLDASTDRPWSVDIVVAEALAPPRPSLVLRAALAYRHPKLEPWLTIAPARASVYARYYEPGQTGRPRRWTRQHDRLRLTHIAPLPVASDLQRLRAGDLIGECFTKIPPDQALSRATLRYEDVLHADPDQLRSRLANRVVLVSDMRDPRHVLPTPDGRRVHGTYALAAATETLLSQGPIRMPSGPQTWLILFAAAVVGALAARLRLRPSLAVLSVAALSLVTVLVCVGAFMVTSMLVNPLMPLAVLIPVALCCGWVSRAARVARV